MKSNPCAQVSAICPFCQQNHKITLDDVKSGIKIMCQCGKRFIAGEEEKTKIWEFKREKTDEPINVAKSKIVSDKTIEVDLPKSNSDEGNPITAILKITFYCPYCTKGFIRYKGQEIKWQGMVSAKCNKCPNVFECDLTTGKSLKTKQPKQKLKNRK